MRTPSSKDIGIREGFRSGLEEKLALQIEQAGFPVLFEKKKIEYITDPHTYTPDFELPGGIIIESKGRFVGKDRAKHLLVKRQHPELDIRFVFTNPKGKLYKGSATTYGQWCDKYGFQYATKEIPQEWFEESKRKAKKGRKKAKVFPRAKFKLSAAPRTVNTLVVHCSATSPKTFVNAAIIDKWHKDKGWLMIGYHYVILRDGTVETGRPINMVGAHVEGHNKDTIGICMVGGVGSDKSTPENNFTPKQFESLQTTLKGLLKIYPQASICGHRDFPKVAKACPSFDVKDWLKANPLK